MCFVKLELTCTLYHKIGDEDSRQFHRSTECYPRVQVRTYIYLNKKKTRVDFIPKPPPLFPRKDDILKQYLMNHQVWSNLPSKGMIGKGGHVALKSASPQSLFLLRRNTSLVFQKCNCSHCALNLKKQLLIATFMSAFGKT
jgi:hypothetical protein